MACSAPPIETLFQGEFGERLEAPRYFVCTNGQRDLCCARFGLPLYNQLRERFGERVWQVSHLGGASLRAQCAGAAPGAVLYGRVGTATGDAGDESVERFAAEVEAGAVSRRYLRGRSCYPKPVQAAEGFAGCDGLEWVALEEGQRPCQGDLQPPRQAAFGQRGRGRGAGAGSGQLRGISS